MRSVAMIMKLIFAVSVFTLIEAFHKQSSSLETNLTISNNHFGSDLLQALNDKNSNILLSPWSLFTALGMLHVGTKGDTFKEIGSVMHLHDISPQEIPSAFCQLTDKLKPPGKLYELNMFNAAVLQEGYGLSKSYREKLQKYFHADIYEVDFINRGSLVTEWLNAWTKLKTGGKIKDVISDIPSPLTRLMLVSTNYFKGVWEKAFSPNNTLNATFYNKGWKEVMTPTMFIRGNFSVLYRGDSDVCAVNIPMKGGINFLLMMPSRQEDFEKLEKNISRSFLKSITESMTTLDIQLYIPKFDLETKLSAQEALQSLGMVSAFQFQSADLSGIASSEGLFVSEIVHHVGVSINEEGAEASSASTVTIVTKQGTPRLHFERPFLFFIIDKKTDLVLFMGRVTTL